MQIKNFLEMTLEDLPNCHEGEGIFYMDEKEYPVRAGSIMKNNPYGIHGLRNTGDAELKILVFENAKDEK